MRRITIKAFAKINLALDVLGKRSDGYHEVDMVMQGINLHDVVEITTAEAEIQLSCTLPELGCAEDNLAYAAALLLQKNYPQVRGLSIHLHKNIPLAAGLAGGSADAAAVLIGVNELYELGLDLAGLQELGARLGSDVPFCLNPLTARARGRGEIMSPLPECPPLWLVLCKPSFGAATAEVYRHLSRVTVPARPDTAKVIAALERQDSNHLLLEAGNVLEYATFDLYPVLREYAQEMMARGSSRVLMSGSGPTLLGFASDESAARMLADALKKEDRKIFVCRTLQRGDLAERISRV